MKDDVKNNSLQIKFPEYKGHTKITLTNVETGEEQIIEKDNMVTNAVRDFLNQDAFGLFDLNNDHLTPLRNMFGGVMCFENPIEENANNYAVPSESANPLTAHAGQTGHNSPSTKRGNPNGDLSGETNGGKGYKFVWDFAVNQGVGQISTVCLTHQLAGDNGTLPYPEFDQNLTPRIDFSTTTWAKAVQHGTRDVAIQKPCIYDPETRQGISLFFSATNKVDVIRVQGDSYKLGLNNKIMRFREVKSDTLTIYRNGSTAFSDTLTSMFVDGNNIYIYGLSSAYTTTIYYAKIDVSADTPTVTNGQWSLSKRAWMSTSNKVWKVHPRYPFNNGYLYLPSYDKTDSDKFTFLRFNINNPSDLEILQDSNIETADWDWTNDGYKSICPINISNDFIVGGHYVINSKVVRKTPYWSNHTVATAAQVFGKNVMIADYVGSGAVYSGAILNPFYLATINVLDTPVTKQNNQTMKIEYEIKEA